MIYNEIPLEAAGQTHPASALDSLLVQRHSTRSFKSQPLNISDLAGLAWAAQGRTSEGRRVCPSAHALYPLTLTIIAGDVDDLPAGAYTYDADRHVLTSVAFGDHRDAVSRTTLADHDWLCQAAVVLLLSGDLNTATEHFFDQPPQGRRGRRYVWLEAGHASQNVYLRAAEAGLGAVLVAGFDDDQLLDLTPAVVPDGHHPLALLGIGHPADPTNA